MAEKDLNGSSWWAADPLVGSGVPNVRVHHTHHGARTTAPAIAAGTSGRRGPRQSWITMSRATSNSPSVRASTVSPATAPTKTHRSAVWRSFAQIQRATRLISQNRAREVSRPPSDMDTPTGEMGPQAGGGDSSHLPGESVRDPSQHHDGRGVDHHEQGEIGSQAGIGAVGDPEDRCQQEAEQWLEPAGEGAAVDGRAVAVGHRAGDGQRVVGVVGDEEAVDDLERPEQDRDAQAETRQAQTGDCEDGRARQRHAAATPILRRCP